MQIFLSAATTLLDDGISHVPAENTQSLFVALIAVLEKMLGVEEGSFRNRIEEYSGAGQ